MTKILINLVTIIVLGIIQVSFLSTWLFPVNSLNLILSLVIFVTVVIDYNKGLWWAFGLGIFLELYSSLPFGLLMMSLFFVVIFINFLFSNIFTNRSLYTLLILGLIGSVCYNLAVSFFYLLFIVFNYNVEMFKFDLWLQFVWQPILNALILTVVFFTYYISTSRLKNIFLTHSN